MTYCYKYPRPALTVDCFVYSRENCHSYLLLVKRGNEPFHDHWALPGGFVEMNELLAESASRELIEETGLNVSRMEQLHVFDGLNRDPRGRTISVVFWAKMDHMAEPAPGSDANDARWFDTDHLPSLAFDHAEVIKFARQRLQI